MLSKAAKSIAFFSSLWLTLTVHAQTDEPNLLFEGDKQALFWLENTFSIEVVDEVSDGCLPQPDNLKTKMEVSLRQSSFAIAEESGLFTPEILIDAIGYAIKGGCVVVIRTEVRKFEIVNVPFSQDYGDDGKIGGTFVMITYPVAYKLLTGAKSNMQRRLEDTVRDHGDKVYLFIARSRDNIRSKFPKIIERYRNLQ